MRWLKRESCGRRGELCQQNAQEMFLREFFYAFFFFFDLDLWSGVTLLGFSKCTP